MTRLNPAALAALPAGIGRPAYDRGALETGIVHLGVGAFHRAHQAVYTDDALAAGDLRWGILGASLRSPETRDALSPQDGLYSIAVLSAEGAERRVIGSIHRLLVAPEDPEALIAAMAEANVVIVSLTVTEKAYCLDPATGQLDERHPDIVHDLANPERPRSALGYLLAALQRRRQAGVAPFTILCCDNLTANGAKLHAALTQLAALTGEDLGRFVADHVACPSTMVDRITPQTTDADREAASRALGVDDAWPIVTEPFTQWIIEDRFPLGRPRWEIGGAVMVEDVAAYETMKLRCLNGAHSTLAYLSASAGVETIAEAMAIPEFAEVIRRLWRLDALPTLQPVPGVDLGDYTRALEARFRNPAIRHRTLQIAMDGSQKLPPRLIATALDLLRSGVEPRIIPLSIAAWMRFLLARTESGDAYIVNDPLAERLTRLARETSGSASALSAALLGVSEVFPAELTDNAAFCADVERRLAQFLQLGVCATVAAVLAESEPGGS